MKKVSFSRIGAKLIQGAEFVRDHADRAGNYLAIVSMVLVLGAGMFGVIRAQTEGYVDANEVFNSGQQKVYVINGDTGQNVQQFGESTFGATTLNLTGTIGGTDWYGPEAQQRGEALDLPMETRIGLLGVIDNEAMALLYNPPNISITKHLANQWLPADESSSTSVYAQFDGTQPGASFLSQYVGIEEIWELFRNIAYAGFVIVIMASGFMIMFRSKINGQTTVNIMNSLPSILVGLVLVTFSFAIAGFLIDMGRLFSAVLYNFMLNNLGGFQPKALSGPFRLAWYAFESTEPISGFRVESGVVGSGVLRTFIMPVINTLIGVIALLIVAAIALYAGFKVFFMLVMTYIKIFLEVILSPVYILMGSLPGKGMVRTDWLKRLISAILVFPVAFLIINIGRYISERSVGAGFTSAIQYLGGGDMGQPLINLSSMFVLAAYFVAAGTPGIVNDLVAVQEGKGMSAAMQGATRSAGKIPIVGGMFGG